MPFDQTTRNRLNRFVGEARTLLSAEFTRQLQHEYGMDPATGDVAALDKLTALNDAQRETARILRTTLGHYVLNAQSEREDLRAEAATWCMRTADYALEARQVVKFRSLVAPLLERIVREQAFTVLNRLAALRMGEARGLIIESVGRGHRSRGFPSYQQLAGSALGETDDAYRCYLFSLCDELATDLPALFDRFSPTGRLFPRPAGLLELLAIINHPDLEPLWPEDETVGWIYQYFNSQEERRQMRAESQAPRNSRELAVRNQFFTPRYVVEFLTDNTLGRIWYEMTQGATKLVETCRYLVRRPCEVFLRDPSQPLAGMPKADWVKAAARGDFSLLPEEPTIDDLGDFSLINYGYDLAARHGIEDVIFWGNEQIDHYRATGEWPTSSLELWLILFRQQRYYGRSDRIEASFLAEWRSAYRSFRASIQRTDLPQEELLRQPVYIPFRRLKDPRMILMLDPACGSMHFGLYAFDLYLAIYEEAWDMQCAACSARWAEGKAPWEVSSGQNAGRQAPADPQAHRFLGQNVDEQTYITCISALNAAGWPYTVDDTALCPLPTAYPNKAAFLRDVPRLIVEHNIHGIDIDPRAVQIAGLSLWLRAQKSWQQQKVKPAERPTISKSNIVCAEPMPGDKGQLDAFLKTLREERLETLIRRVLAVPEHQRVRATLTMSDALCDLVRVVWEEMKLAGEAGSLLKIEESLAAAIQTARDEWAQQPLFRVETFRLTEADAAPAKPQINYTRTVPGEGTDFWERAETLVLAALAQYAEQADGDSYARRLFAADAARGFAFIDVCRKEYDVALMNPPFGLAPRPVFENLKQTYPDTYTDLYACCVSRGLKLTPHGFVGAITSRAFLVTKKLVRWRCGELVPSITLLLDLGAGIMDEAFVEAAAYILRPDYSTATIIAYDRRLMDSKDSTLSTKEEQKRSVVRRNDIQALPGQKLLYQLPQEFFQLLNSRDIFEPTIGTAREGLRTFDDFRFVRLRWEVHQSHIGLNRVWESYAKGGEFARYYSDIHLLVKWNGDGNELAAVNLLVNGQVAQSRQASEYYRRFGATYSKRSAKGFSARALPAGCIIGTKGPAVLSESDVSAEYLVGWLNSRLITDLIHIQANAYEFNTGIIKKLPWRHPHNVEQLSEVSRRAIIAICDFRRLTETNSLYLSPMLGDDVHMSAALQLSVSDFAAKCTTDCQLLWDDAINKAYEVPHLAHAQFGVVDANEIDELEEDDDTSTFTLIGADEVSRALVSYAIGNAMGRWDIRLARCYPKNTVHPDPFDVLPACSPGMLQNAAGLPATPGDVPADYPLRISWPGILVDDPGHPEDIVGRVREALAVIWDGSGQRVEGSMQTAEGSAEAGAALPTANHPLPTLSPTANRQPPTADAIEQEACQILGVPSLGAYFGNPSRFFDDHLKRYSKSRRQAPIYWPLSTPSGSYTLWIYYHRLNDQMLYTCADDFVETKRKDVAEELARLRQRKARSRDDERELERLTNLETELKEFRAELLRLAPSWKPNLNDGVQITAAPLWKLFQHRGWQRTLRETWEKLEAGDYDWAHLAMSLWPARVVPKCTTDRSLAIAHDVEDLFWVEENGRWRGLVAPDEEIARQRARQQARLSAAQRGRLQAALRQLAAGSARGIAASVVAQHLAEGDWDDTELALLCWPERVAEKCLDDPALANALRLNLPPKRTKSAVNRWMAELAATGCPAEAAALLATLDDDIAFDHLLAELEAGRRDRAPLALPLWPDRVIDRCLENPDLAAAHDLRRFFWVEDGSGWRRRREPGVEVVMEIERRR